MRLAKIVKNQIVGIVESDIADDRKDESGALIYRPIQDEPTPIPETHGVIGDEYIIKDDHVVKKLKTVQLTKGQILRKKLSEFYHDPELPTVDQRLDALESGDKEKISSNAAKVSELRKKHGIE